jgi:RHS repeat-associated protein
MMIDSNQGAVAKYLYDTFGNTISKSGLLADANVYRFSSKEWHQNSGLAYYLYRYYDPNLQRWPNRDPLADPGIQLKVFKTPRALRTPLEFLSPNLYAYADNDPVDWTDAVGMMPIQKPPPNHTWPPKPPGKCPPPPGLDPGAVCYALCGAADGLCFASGPAMPLCYAMCGALAGICFKACP